ncbi:hypothetical protein CCHR01_12696 [Colletotrichum chrysophilum]|uniref:Uncharacterized protein n=1 Tax=Colletotrichum chrysophilum TaxID=1836956 RepID=A0AAD9AC11_9PEZI|nr:hypothetical protein CCHR01_12696 [Colletotrichum chrysophilum]
MRHAVAVERPRLSVFNFQSPAPIAGPTRSTATGLKYTENGGCTAANSEWHQQTNNQVAGEVQLKQISENIKKHHRGESLLDNAARLEHLALLQLYLERDVSHIRRAELGRVRTSGVNFNGFHAGIPGAME